VNDVMTQMSAVAVADLPVSYKMVYRRAGHVDCMVDGCRRP